MENKLELRLERTEDLPEVDFNAQTGKLSITGSSFSENVFKIFEQIISWAKMYLKNPSKNTEIHIDLKLYNSQTEKYLINFLSLFEQSKKTKTTVYWYYQNSEDLETGRQHETLIKLKFIFVKSQYDEQSES